MLGPPEPGNVGDAPRDDRGTNDAGSRMMRLRQHLQAVRPAYRRIAWVAPFALRVGLFALVIWFFGLTSALLPTADAGELQDSGYAASAQILARADDQSFIQQIPTATFDRGSDPIAPVTTPTPTLLPIHTPIPPPPPPIPPPVASPAVWPALPPTATPIGDPCWGDEQITYIPESPRTNNELIIAVTSSKPHPYGRVAGTERTTFVLERPGQLGYVWEWSVAPTWPGRHKYTFYVDSTVPCKEIEIVVRQQYFTPTPDLYSDNSSEDGDNNSDDGDNGEDGDNN